MRGLFFSTITFIALLFSLPSPAQTSNWQEVQTFIHSQKFSVNTSRDLDSLASKIIHHYADSVSRLKAVYVWVTENISYDVPGSNQIHYVNSVDSVLKYKTAVCAGYVDILRLLCEKVGITCKEIGGYGRSGTQPFSANEKFVEDHSWAAVWLNRKWNLIDVTWGSGFVLEGTSKFIRQTNDWFFFADPAKFIWDHYPRNPQWQLLADTVTWNAFKNYPSVGIGARENLIQNFSPSESLIQTAAGNKISFSFTTDKVLNTILLISKEKNFTERGSLERRNNIYTYTFKVPYNGVYDLRIDLLYLEPGTTTINNSLIDFVYWIDARTSAQ